MADVPSGPSLDSTSLCELTKIKNGEAEIEEEQFNACNNTKAPVLLSFFSQTTEIMDFMSYQS
jgi:hypothetical protein